MLSLTDVSLVFSKHASLEILTSIKRMNVKNAKHQNLTRERHVAQR